MANTSQIKQDYFKLLNLLNKGNKKSNEKTEVYFYIEQIGSEFLFFAAISLKQFSVFAEVKISNEEN